MSGNEEKPIQLIHIAAVIWCGLISVSVLWSLLETIWWLAQPWAENIKPFYHHWVRSFFEAYK